MQRTSKQWWESVKKDPTKLSRWLKAQYHGEVTAARRIGSLITPKVTGRTRALLTTIAEQETQHAHWVAVLLMSRGIRPKTTHKRERYWDKTLPKGQASLRELAAVGAHAETMRLARIRVIAADRSAPADIRAVFKAILPQEKFHAWAFESIAGKRALKKARDNHELGMNALGLVA